MSNIINDDIKLLLAVNKNPIVEKIFPIRQTLATGDLPPHGNNLPVKAATSEYEKQQVVGTEEIEEAVRSLNEHSKEIKRELHFTIDETSGQTVITVMNSVTSEVIRQIPNEEAVNVARRLVEGSDLSLLNEYS